MNKRSRDPLDMTIGKRVRALRLQRGMSQTELANALDLTFQQVQKYEKGANRISAGRLQRIAEILEVPVTFFFSGFSEEHGKRDAKSVESEFDFLQTGGAMRLVRAYSRIRESGVRLRLLRLTESLAGE